MEQRTRLLMNLSIGKVLGNHQEGGGCQSIEALLFRQSEKVLGIGSALGRADHDEDLSP
jgi:hypothetical protein